MIIFNRNFDFRYTDYSRRKLICYRISEYLGLFDISDLPHRLKCLQLGAKIYLDSGYSFYQFCQFHQNKQLSYRYGSYFINILFLLLALLLYMADGPIYLSLLCILCGLVIQRHLVSSAIGANILHVNKMLSGQDGLRNLKELMAISVDDELAFKDLSTYINWGFPFLQPLRLQNRKVISNIDTKNRRQIRFDFKYELRLLRSLPNQFNAMPMEEVIEFFYIMCCDACKKEIPQMTEQDFILFLNAAFIRSGKKDKIKLSTRRLMITYQIFHQFYLTCYNKFYSNNDGNIDNYISLLTDHIEGFDHSKVKNNFRTNDDYYLPRIREKYKPFLQNLQQLH
jgi:hypothetical protein